MTIIISTLNALIPVFLIIALGFALKRKNVFPAQMWQAFGQLCYYIMIPMLVVKNLARSDLSALPLQSYIPALVMAILVMSLLLLMLRPLLCSLTNLSDAAFTSLFQGTTRWQSMIALSVTGMLYGDTGITYTAIIIATIVPLLNLLNVSILVIYGNGTFHISRIVTELLKNPLIIACFLGLSLNLSGIGLAEPLYKTLSILSGGAMGLSLLIVGAGITLKMQSDDKKLVGIATILRLVLMPALMLLSCFFMGIDGVARSAAIIAASVPTAGASYILACQMGGDAPLMANIMTVQVMASAITLPIAIILSEGIV